MLQTQPINTTILKNDIKDFTHDKARSYCVFKYRNTEIYIDFLYGRTLIDNYDIKTYDGDLSFLLAVQILREFLYTVRTAPIILDTFKNELLFDTKYGIIPMIPTTENIGRFDKNQHYYESDFFVIIDKNEEFIIKITEDSTKEELKEFLSYVIIPEFDIDLNPIAYLTFANVKSLIVKNTHSWKEEYDEYDIWFGFWSQSSEGEKILIAYNTLEEAELYIKEVLTNPEFILTNKYEVKKIHTIIGYGE